MKRKNNKGFTLIELLAVIVILGIILTIVVSNVVKYIGQARRGSYRDAVSVFVKNVQTALMADAVEGGDGKIDTTNPYDYDKSNMTITINSVAAGKSNHKIVIVGKNSFKDLDISDAKYCPNGAAECGNGATGHAAKGTVILYMSPEGELKATE